MTSKERFQATLQHKKADTITVDFGATAVTGIHVLAVERLRAWYGLERRPVKVIEPYQMLGEIDDELKDIMGVDIVGISPRNNMFGFANEGWKEFRTFWGQEVLVPSGFNTGYDVNGDLLIYPEGDNTVPPSGRMPKTSYFFDSIIRQQPIDEASLRPEDNLEEFKPLSAEDIAYWKSKAAEAAQSPRGIIANFGGTALGDIALVPAPFLKSPKGIRDITEWYMSLMMRPDFVREVFDHQSQIAVQNLETLHSILGDTVDAVFICGTDFGTQDSQFCSPEQFSEIYLPYYRRINDWIHQHTSWRTFKHSCGAVEPLIGSLIEAGFDILNPVQINAAGMDSQLLVDKYGDHLVFWGGGVDTQKVLSFGTPHDVRKQVEMQCRVLAGKQGFVFNTVHNIQANVPVENMAAMIDTLNAYRGR